MKLSNISTTPYRPNIKRVGQKNLSIPHYVNEFDCPSTKSTKTRLGNRVSLGFRGTEAFGENLKKGSQKNHNTDKKHFTWKVCFCIVLIVLLFLIIGAIIGIALGLILPQQSTTITTTIATAASTGSAGTSTVASTTPNTASITTTAAATTTTTITCSNIGRGSIMLQTGTTPTTWTSYTSSFTANQSMSTLLFGFATEGTNSFYLDDVSLVLTSAPGIQLLTNPSFENSNSVPISWTISCEMTTCGANSTRVETNSVLCSSGYCLESFCSVGRSSLAFISQTVATTNGNTYTISFDIRRSNIPSTGTMTFSLDII